MLDGAIRFAEAENVTIGLSDSSATAYAVRDAGSDTNLEVDSTALGVRIAEALTDNVEVSLEASEADTTRLAKAKIKSNVVGLTYIKESLTRKWRVNFVEAETDTICRGTSKAIPNSWMGKASSTVEGFLTSDPLKIHQHRASYADAYGQLTSGTIPHLVTQTRSGTVIELFSYAVPDIIRASGVTERYAETNLDVTGLTESNPIRYAKAHAAVSSELITEPTPRTNFKAKAVAVAELVSAAEALQLDKGVGQVVIECTTSASAKIVTQRAYANAVGELVTQSDPEHFRKVDAFTVTNIYLDTYGDARLFKRSDATADTVVALDSSAQASQEHKVTSTTDIELTVSEASVLTRFAESETTANLSVFETGYRKANALSNVQIELVSVGSGVRNVLPTADTVIEGDLVADETMYLFGQSDTVLFELESSAETSRESFMQADTSISATLTANPLVITQGSSQTTITGTSQANAVALRKGHSDAIIELTTTVYSRAGESLQADSSRTVIVQGVSREYVINAQNRSYVI